VRIARGNNADLNGDGMVFLGDVTHDGRLDENDLPRSSPTLRPD
jgi:hypothetical protein